MDTMNQQNVPATGWLVVEQHGMKLALSQADVRSMGEVLSLQKHASLGIWEDADSHWPAVLLDTRLSMIESMADTPSGRYVVYLEALHQPLGWICDAVHLLPAEQGGEILPLPAIIAQSAGCARGLLRLPEGGVATWVDGGCLAMALGSRLTQRQEVESLETDDVVQNTDIVEITEEIV